MEKWGKGREWEGGRGRKGRERGGIVLQVTVEPGPHIALLRHCIALRPLSYPGLRRIMDAPLLSSVSQTFTDVIAFLHLTCTRQSPQT